MSKRKYYKSNYRELPAHGKLELFLLNRRGLTTHTHAQKPREKEIKERTSLVLVPAGPLAWAESRQEKWRPTPTPALSVGDERTGLHTQKALPTTRLDTSAPDRVPPFSSSGLQPHERFAKNASAQLCAPPFSLPRSPPPRLSLLPLRPLFSLGQSGPPTRLLSVNVTAGAFPPPYSRTRSSFWQAASLRPPALLSRAGTRREIAPRLRRASIPPRGDRVHTARWLWWGCSELEGCVWRIMGAWQDASVAPMWMAWWSKMASLWCWRVV